MSDFDMIRATKAYKEFLEKGKKHITEHDFHDVLGNSCREAFDDHPRPGVNYSFNGAMGWWHKKRQAMREVLKADGIEVHWNDEFETQFNEWYLKQELPVVNGPLHGLKVYSQKREEFEALYKEKMKEIGME